MAEKALVVAIFVGAIAFAGYNILVNRFKELQASDELHPALRKFHDKYTYEPRKNMTIGPRIHRAYMLEIERTLRRNGICHHLEHYRVLVRQSSADDDIEFNVMLVIDKYEYDLQVLHDYNIPGYAWLKINRYEQPSPDLKKLVTYWNFFGDFFVIGDLLIDPDKRIYIFLNNLHRFFRYIFAGDLYVDPGKTIDFLFSELQELINHSAQMKSKVKLSRNELAIRMDVHPDSGVLLWGPRLYSVDLVPAYKVYGTLYVSKPLKGEIPNRMTWRRSFSVDNKQNLYGGPKCVLRAFEAVRNSVPELEPLTLNHLKTALYHEMDWEYDWSDRALVLRFLGVLRRLEISLANENLPHNSSPEINLFSSISSSSLRNMRDIIKRIRSSENELMEILTS